MLGSMTSLVIKNPYWVNLNYIKICAEKNGCNYEESSSLCKESGGNLAIIANKSQNDLTTSLLQQVPKLNSDITFAYWIGLTDLVGIIICMHLK